jgi:hypothetical protein
VWNTIHDLCSGKPLWRPRGTRTLCSGLPTAEAVGFLMLRPGRAGSLCEPAFPTAETVGFLILRQGRTGRSQDARPPLKRWALLSCARGPRDACRTCFPTAEALALLYCAWGARSVPYNKRFTYRNYTHYASLVSALHTYASRSSG